MALKVDYEGELAVILGRDIRDADAATVLDAVSHMRRQRRHRSMVAEERCRRTSGTAARVSTPSARSAGSTGDIRSSDLRFE